MGSSRRRLWHPARRGPATLSHPGGEDRNAGAPVPQGKALWATATPPSRVWQIHGEACLIMSDLAARLASEICVVVS